MTVILYICIGVLLARAAADICVGLLRILACLAAFLIGVAPLCWHALSKSSVPSG